jgi:hypothetical protein
MRRWDSEAEDVSSLPCTRLTSLPRGGKWYAPEDHDDAKAYQANSGSYYGRFADMAEKKPQLVNWACMTYTTNLGSQVLQTEFWDQLINNYNESNSRDKASKEGPWENGVEEAQSGQSSNEDDRSSHPCYYASHTRMNLFSKLVL